MRSRPLREGSPAGAEQPSVWVSNALPCKIRCRNCVSPGHSRDLLPFSDAACSNVPNLCLPGGGYLQTLIMIIIIFLEAVRPLEPSICRSHNFSAACHSSFCLSNCEKPFSYS